MALCVKICWFASSLASVGWNVRRKSAVLGGSRLKFHVFMTAASKQANDRGRRAAEQVECEGELDKTNAAGFRTENGDERGRWSDRAVELGVVSRGTTVVAGRSELMAAWR